MCGSSCSPFHFLKDSAFFTSGEASSGCHRMKSLLQYFSSVIDSSHFESISQWWWSKNTFTKWVTNLARKSKARMNKLIDRAYAIIVVQHSLFSLQFCCLGKGCHYIDSSESVFEPNISVHACWSVAGTLLFHSGLWFPILVWSWPSQHSEIWKNKLFDVK